jgi:hypothetical protein
LRPYLLESGADGGGSFSPPAFVALCLFLLIVGSWVWSAGRMFWNSGTLLFGNGGMVSKSRSAPVLPIVVDKSEPTVEPLVIVPTGEPVEFAPASEPVVVEVVAEEDRPGGGAQVTSTAAPGCEVYCQAVAYCEELERLNPRCVVVWPEE